MVAFSFQGVSAISFLALVQANLIGFDSFIQKYARTYTNGSSEFKMRRALYEKRKAEFDSHNNNPNRMWTAGVNKLWDWTEAELQTLHGWDGSAKPAGGGNRPVRKHAQFLQQPSELPQEKFWSNLQMTRHVRNQGRCGSCWAIAAATVLEGHTEIYTGKARTFSAQQIIECTPNPRHCGGDGGCKGATAELALDWVLKNGCAEESSIPYMGQDNMCEASPPASPNLNMAQDIFDDGPTYSSSGGGAAFGMTGWETLPKNEYEPLKRALAERGPVAVSVAAHTWHAYESGIFDSCSPDAIVGHAVVAVGYGQEADDRKYWLIQNSWGEDWGEDGHIRLLRHDENDNCGTDNDPQKGIACEGETAPVPVCGQCGVLFDSVVPHFTS